MKHGCYEKENYVSGMPMGWWMGHLVGRLVARTKLLAHAPVIDLGCGCGAAVAMLSESGLFSIGVDINLSAIAVARHNAARHDKAAFVVASATNLPFKNDSFNSGYAFEMLEHIWPNDQVAVHNELQRVLKASAQFVATVPLGMNCYNHTHVSFFSRESMLAQWEDFRWRVRFCGMVDIPTSHGGGSQIGMIARPPCFL